MVDTKISDLTSLTASAGEDLLAIVDDPGGTPVTKKISIEDLFDVTFTNANTGIDFDNFSLTGSNATSFVNLAGTWNTTGTPTAIKLNVTDTASNASSLLMDLQVGGTSKFGVTKSGVLRIADELTISLSSGYMTFSSDAGFARVRAYSFWHTGMGAGFGDAGVAGGSTIQLASASDLGWTSTAAIGAGTFDTRLWRDAANTLALRNSTNAQTFNVYNTYTDASNYERGFVKFASNLLLIGMEAAGTGSNRELRLAATSGMKGGSVATNGANYWFSNNGKFQVVRDSGYYWTSSTADAGASSDTSIIRVAAGIIKVADGSTGGGSVELQEVTAPSAPATNNVRIYAEDNGAGKTRLMALFPSGAAQQIAIEP